jgi:peroxiredoxin
MFANEISLKEYRTSLAQFHAEIARLKPGNEAPPFTLKNLEGKDVSLSDFKGKLVYIDFWGIYCAPCIYQIKNYTPKLMEKYKNKDIVFLNICVDPTLDEDWKAKVKELNLEGVNLISKGWTTSQVCKDYNISGIPAYVLIDKEGKIINAKMALPNRLIGNFINQIDRALR